jgi:hypothetical protein
LNNKQQSPGFPELAKTTEIIHPNDSSHYLIMALDDANTSRDHEIITGSYLGIHQVSITEICKGIDSPLTIRKLAGST